MFDNEVTNEKLIKSNFLLSSSRNILFVKWIESLLHSTSKKFEFVNLESCFHKRQVSFLVAKIAKYKRGISYILVYLCYFCPIASVPVGTEV